MPQVYQPQNLVAYPKNAGVVDFGQAINNALNAYAAIQDIKYKREAIKQQGVLTALSIESANMQLAFDKMKFEAEQAKYSPELVAMERKLKLNKLKQDITDASLEPEIRQYIADLDMQSKAGNVASYIDTYDMFYSELLPKLSSDKRREVLDLIDQYEARGTKDPATGEVLSMGDARISGRTKGIPLTVTERTEFAAKKKWLSDPENALLGEAGWEQTKQIAKADTQLRLNKADIYTKIMNKQQEIASGTAEQLPMTPSEEIAGTTVASAVSAARRGTMADVIFGRVLPGTRAQTIGSEISNDIFSMARQIRETAPAILNKQHQAEQLLLAQEIEDAANLVQVVADAELTPKELVPGYGSKDLFTKLAPARWKLLWTGQAAKDQVNRLFDLKRTMREQYAAGNTENVKAVADQYAKEFENMIRGVLQQKEHLQSYYELNRLITSFNTLATAEGAGSFEVRANPSDPTDVRIDRR